MDPESFAMRSGFNLLILAMVLGGCQRPTSSPTPGQTADPVASPVGQAYFRALTFAYPGRPDAKKSFEARWLCAQQATGIKAQLNTPASLGLGALEFQFRPQPKTQDQEVEVYIGSSEQVASGQPIKLKRKEALYFMSSPWVGSPPLMFPELDKDTKAAGEYQFSTSLPGGARVNLKHDFLPAMRLVQPTSGVVTSGGAAVTIQWEPVEGAEAYAVSATGDGARGGKAFWYAPALYERELVETGPVATRAKGNLFGPEQRTCVIPAGIFKESIVSVSAFSESQVAEGAIPMRAWCESVSTFDLK